MSKEKRVYTVTSRSNENIGMTYGIFTNRKLLLETLNEVIGKSISYNELNKELKDNTSFYIDDGESIVEVAEIILNNQFKW